MARCECFTASGSSRVVPEVYWKIARSSAFVAARNVDGKAPRLARNASSATTTGTSIAGATTGAFSAFVTSSRGVQSSMRSFTPSGPNRVNSGTAMAPAFIAPNSAM